MRYQIACKNISIRHLEMAEILKDRTYYEGAVFHAFHALEAISCAALGEEVDLSDSEWGRPGIHERRLELFYDLYQKEEVKRTFSKTCQALASLTQQRGRLSTWSKAARTRNATLYFKDDIEPHKRFQSETTRKVIDRVYEVVKLIVSEMN